MAAICLLNAHPPSSDEVLSEPTSPGATSEASGVTVSSGGDSMSSKFKQRLLKRYREQTTTPKSAKDIEEAVAAKKLNHQGSESFDSVLAGSSLDDDLVDDECSRSPASSSASCVDDESATVSNGGGNKSSDAATSCSNKLVRLSMMRRVDDDDVDIVDEDDDDVDVIVEDDDGVDDNVAHACFPSPDNSSAAAPASPATTTTTTTENNNNNNNNNTKVMTAAPSRVSNTGSSSNNASSNSNNNNNGSMSPSVADPYVCALCGECFSGHVKLVHHVARHLDSVKGAELGVDGTSSSPLLSANDASLTMAAIIQQQPAVAEASAVTASQLLGLGSAAGNGSSSSSKRHFLCLWCHRQFRRSDMLTRHIRVHTGFRPYRCGICSQLFSRTDHLATHIRTHTGDKPYACTVCSYTACRKDMINRHMKIHGSQQAASASATTTSAVATTSASAVIVADSSNQHHGGHRQHGNGGSSSSSSHHHQHQHLLVNSDAPSSKEPLVHAAVEAAAVMADKNNHNHHLSSAAKFAAAVASTFPSPTPVVQPTAFPPLSLPRTGVPQVQPPKFDMYANQFMAAAAALTSSNIVTESPFWLSTLFNLQAQFAASSPVGCGLPLAPPSHHHHQTPASLFGLPSNPLLSNCETTPFFYPPPANMTPSRSTESVPSVISSSQSSPQRTQRVSTLTPPISPPEIGNGQQHQRPRENIFVFP